MLSIERFKAELERLCVDFREKKYLLAVSGGVDSMVLASLFAEVFQGGAQLFVAHINYHLRGEDSNLDQQLVEAFCQEKNIPVYLYSVSNGDGKPASGSIQLWARELRYRFFYSLLEEHRIDYLVTAHHLGDQLETFIINLSRGSGIKGLCGIPSKGENILRPLLNFTKEELYDYAERCSIPYREDKSNKKDDYLRNKIRNHISPLLSELSPHFLNNFNKSLHLLSQAKTFAEGKVDEVFNGLSHTDRGDIVINKTKLVEESPFVQFEILKNFGFENLTEIEKIFSSQTGAVFISGSHYLFINRDELILQERNDAHKQEIHEIVIEDAAHTNTIRISDYIDEPLPAFLWKFDAHRVKFPLKLRRKNTGDIFFPTGMKGRKKVSKFFKDEKLSTIEKQRIWILTDADAEVLGIIPHRQDRRKQAREETQNLLNIRD